MKNIKENNIRKTLWHIKRHCKNIENNYEMRIVILSYST